MLRLRPYGLACILLLLVGVRPLWAQEQDAVDSRTPTIAVTEFAGSDREVGRFIAETLLTDLAVSDKVRVVEGADVRRAANEAGIRTGQPLDPRDARRLGAVVRADRILVGSYLVQDGQLVINARLLDTRTGRIVPGAAANVSGPRRDILGIANKLASTLHRRITGSDLYPSDNQVAAAPAAGDDAKQDPSQIDPPQRDAGDREAPVDSPRTDSSPRDLARNDVGNALDRLIRLGVAPSAVQSTDTVTTRGLALLTRRVAHKLGGRAMSDDALVDAPTKATRIRTLVAIVKAALPADQITDAKDIEDDQLTPDVKDIPAWARPYVATAIKNSWWAQDERLRPQDPATWGFVGAVAGEMSFEGDLDAPAAQKDDQRAEPRSERPYTGLVIDARELMIDRAPSPHIRDEDGNLVYPETTHVPDSEYIQDHGMVSYCESLDDATRAGAHPLIVKALSAAGAGKDDFVIANEDAERIRRANRSDKFLTKWAVCILQAPR